MKGSDSILNGAIAAVELVVNELHTVTSVRQETIIFKNSFAFINSQAVKKLFDR